MEAIERSGIDSELPSASTSWGREWL
jgi:hypothetical protein